MNEESYEKYEPLIRAWDHYVNTVTNLALFPTDETQNDFQAALENLIHALSQLNVDTKDYRDRLFKWLASEGHFGAFYRDNSKAFNETIIELREKINDKTLDDYQRKALSIALDAIKVCVRETIRATTPVATGVPAAPRKAYTRDPSSEEIKKEFGALTKDSAPDAFRLLWTKYMGLINSKPYLLMDIIKMHQDKVNFFKAVDRSLLIDGDIRVEALIRFPELAANKRYLEAGVNAVVENRIAASKIFGIPEVMADIAKNPSMLKRLEGLHILENGQLPPVEVQFKHKWNDFMNILKTALEKADVERYMKYKVGKYKKYDDTVMNAFLRLAELYAEIQSPEQLLSASRSNNLENTQFNQVKFDAVEHLLRKQLLEEPSLASHVSFLESALLASRLAMLDAKELLSFMKQNPEFLDVLMSLEAFQIPFEMDSHMKQALLREYPECKKYFATPEAMERQTTAYAAEIHAKQKKEETFAEAHASHLHALGKVYSPALAQELQARFKELVHDSASLPSVETLEKWVNHLNEQKMNSRAYSFNLMDESPVVMKLFQLDPDNFDQTQKEIAWGRVVKQYENSAFSYAKGLPKGDAMREVRSALDNFMKFVGAGENLGELAEKSGAKFDPNTHDHEGSRNNLVYDGKLSKSQEEYHQRVYEAMFTLHGKPTVALHMNLRK